MELIQRRTETDLGQVPPDWDAAPLNTLGTGARPPVKAGPFGSSLKKEEYTVDGYKVYGQEQVIRGDHLYGEYFIDARKYRSLSSCSVLPGDVLLSLVGTAGKVLVVPEGAPEGIINPRLIRFAFDGDRVVPQFIKALFESDQMQRLLANRAQGGTMAVLSAGLLSSIVIPLPKVEEQRAIAAALSEVDDLVAALDALIEKKRAVKTAAMQRLLTGRQRLPGFSGEWKTWPLGEVAHIKTGSKDNQDKVEGGTYPFFVRSQTVERINSYSYDCEAILVPGEGGIGSIFHYIDGKFEVHQRVYKISDFSDEAIGKYVYYYMLAHFGDHAMRNSVKATVDSLRLPTFKEFELHLPEPDEQGAIVAVLSDMGAEIAALEARCEKTRMIKQGMMQELHTGRTRLV